MKEEEEDMLIALYLTGEGKDGFDEAHMKKVIITMRLIKKVRDWMKKTRGC